MASARYVYAIVGRGTPLPRAGSCSVANELAIVPWRELAAVTRRIGGSNTTFTMDAVLQHEVVVEAVRQRGPALPVRFGTLFRDAPSVASALAERYDVLEADLRRVGNKVEMSLTAIWRAGSLGDAPHDGSVGQAERAEQSAGARYLRARAAELRREEGLKERARTVGEELDRVLGGHSLERRVSLLPKAGVAIRAAYLLAPGGVGAFRAAFESIRGTSSEIRVLLTGPWPPYSFVRRPAADSGTASDGRLAELAELLTNAIGHCG